MISKRERLGLFSVQGYSAFYKEGLWSGLKIRGFCCCCFAMCGKYFYVHTVHPMNRDNRFGILIEI